MFWSKKQAQKPESNPNELLKAFVQASPSSTYTFDSERDAPESEICRQKGGGLSKECQIIHINSKKLFESMQNMGFFCALPLDPSKTYMECVPIPK